MIKRRKFPAGLAATPLAAPIAGGEGRELSLVCFNIWRNQGNWAARQPLLIDAMPGALPVDDEHASDHFGVGATLRPR